MTQPHTRSRRTAGGRAVGSKPRPAVADTHLRPAQSGTQGRLFANPTPGPDETSFQVDNSSGAYYESKEYEHHEKEVQPIPAPRVAPPRMDIAEIVGGDSLRPIITSGRIVFHAVGDTGAAKVDLHQTAEEALKHEGWVADAMARDVAQGGPDVPSFLFHLGDVIYNFGEEEYYYDQFYEPFRAYDAPIFAIPGNHDGGVVYEEGASAPHTPTLQAFLRNFCTVAPEPAAMRPRSPKPISKRRPSPLGNTRG